MEFVRAFGVSSKVILKIANVIAGGLHAAEVIET